MAELGLKFLLPDEQMSNTVTSVFLPEGDDLEEFIAKMSDAGYTVYAGKGIFYDMGEISAQISENLFDSLDAPVVRIGALNTPVPFSPGLEPIYLPNAEDIVKAARSQG